MLRKVRVWDLPTRCFHWALAVFFFGLLTTAQMGGDAMVWHFRCGYAVLTLLLFRIIWGVIGGRWSRFSSFIYAPGTIWSYLKGRGLPEHSIGHSPLGAGSVFALLGFLLVQVATGLVSDDEIAAAGPLGKFVSGELVSAATFYHTAVGKLILIGLALLHIGAILFYHFKKHQNLVLPMILGDKVSDLKVDNSKDDKWSRVLALVVLSGCAALVVGMVMLAG